jgi:predicted hotdog family 3-hydroxylacyl-ACP dehydratase
VGFEFMAQAISALSGIKGRLVGEEPKIGFIMSVSSMKIGLSSFKAGSVIEVKVKERDSIGLVYNFTGEIFLEGRKVMEGSLTVMDVSDEQIETLRKGN